MDFNDWAARHPQAAAELREGMGAVPWPTIPEGGDGKSENWAQQRARFRIAHAGAMSWRNNVGATPAKCPDCNAPRQPIRYGLANDSAQLNGKVKSSDLILAIPRLSASKTWAGLSRSSGASKRKDPGGCTPERIRNRAKRLGWPLLKT